MKLLVLLTALASTATVFAHEGQDHSHDVEDVDELDMDEDTIVAPPIEEDEVVQPLYKPSKVNGLFVEQFDGDTSRWVTSETKKIVDGVEDEDLLRYRGTWNVEEPVEWPGIRNDKALVVKTPAAHHAISAKFATPLDPKGKTLVVQYEVKFQKTHDCGGAYMKLLTHDPGFDATKFDDKSPFTIMFGPDKCGSNNKVHFIFRHKNPITGEYEEKHMNSPPQAKIEKKTGLYTLIVKPDNTFDLLINNEKVKSGNLLEDFTPPVNPPKQIDDPEDSKPSDWVDEEKIPDENAKKPDDWDEDAPMEIPDEDATKPSDWLDNEPSSIPDPDAEKPEDWDDEEDGDWQAPAVPNPKCESVGCGEWVRPTIKNPKYKGKWSVPFVDNPKYKGVWAPRKIDNPKYFEDKFPANFNKIGAIGYELWTMSDGISFDNIYVGYSVEDARKLSEEQWKVKYEVEKKFENKEKPVSQDSKNADSSENPYLTKLKDFIHQVQAEFEVIKQKWESEGPLETLKTFKYAFAGAFLVAYFLLSSFFKLIFGSSASPAGTEIKKLNKKNTKKEKDSDGEEEEEEEEVDEKKPEVVKKKPDSLNKRKKNTD
ncbi:hypothetical protein HK099_005822 [Clydaea vesicula]|uniref:Calnexin n=1 Tax=Clydaea vesicula TaxID=447962 RepID=A0AAD5U120_9FUNG|nr:hypothetical protein HK099_005822 [Clydaea vesicula]